MGKLLKAFTQDVLYLLSILNRDYGKLPGQDGLWVIVPALFRTMGLEGWLYEAVLNKLDHTHKYFSFTISLVKRGFYRAVIEPRFFPDLKQVRFTTTLFFDMLVSYSSCL